MTTTEVGIDPHRFVNTGDRTYDIPNYSSRNTGVLVDDPCSEEGRGGWYCSRTRHSEQWQHIAASGSSIARTWGGADPFAAVQLGDNVSGLEHWQNVEKGLRIPVDERWCRAATQTIGRFCTRINGHPIDWGHYSVAHDGNVIGVLRPISFNEPYVELVPEDGSAPDPQDQVLTSPPVNGTVVKLRDRGHVLFVIGYRSENDTVETLNLTSPDEQNVDDVPLYRVIPLDHLVHTLAGLSMEDMPRIQRWFNEHREKVRQVGIREMRKGTWCRPGMEEAFREMAVDPFEPEMRGDMHLHMRFSCADASTGRSEVQQKLNLLFGAPEFRAMFEGLDGLTLDWAASSVTADNFHRG